MVKTKKLHTFLLVALTAQCISTDVKEHAYLPINSTALCDLQCTNAPSNVIYPKTRRISATLNPSSRGSHIARTGTNPRKPQSPCGPLVKRWLHSIRFDSRSSDITSGLLRHWQCFVMSLSAILTIHYFVVCGCIFFLAIVDIKVVRLRPLQNI